jgi:hypothetical protein
LHGNYYLIDYLIIKTKCCWQLASGDWHPFKACLLSFSKAAGNWQMATSSPSKLVCCPFQKRLAAGNWHSFKACLLSF